jgi:hypothetical protein
MTDAEKQQLKQWVETWKRAGPELERFRYEELRALTHEQSMAAIQDLLELGYQFARPRQTSGLVEQQRLFRKLRR